MALKFIYRHAELTIDRRALRRLADRILDDHGSREADITIVLAGDDLLRELNRRYRGVDTPTDVLAFPMGGGEFGESDDAVGAPCMLGDVVISVDRARVQARRYRRTPAREIGKLVAHGILHLLGYDHEGADERRTMRRLENSYLRASAL